MVDADARMQMGRDYELIQSKHTNKHAYIYQAHLNKLTSSMG
jgi:hypothetical protein